MVGGKIRTRYCYTNFSNSDGVDIECNSYLHMGNLMGL